MEYDFRRDLYDEPEAVVEMEQALFGRWLSEELGSNRSEALRILQQAEQRLSERRGQFDWHGHELSLQLDSESARVWPQSEGNTDELEDGYGLADEACEAGLEDFIGLLQGWIDYIG
ncbi:YacL family protein [Marinobacterium weihaiense]|uniref:YacL family protein n=1 Tax=Marinobacterium weihaiense TaxID=2851016 RepID=A0ABS6MAJ7_9GAMM|nr:YacL family protein [Marinobacterium weihaiense]MBV0933322.1 YacL family protein [Marinobacterium weihaiense]